jgi:hypothetical protein
MTSSRPSSLAGGISILHFPPTTFRPIASCPASAAYPPKPARVIVTVSLMAMALNDEIRGIKGGSARQIAAFIAPDGSLVVAALGMTLSAAASDSSGERSARAAITRT